LAAFFYSSALNPTNPKNKEHLELVEKYPTLLAYAQGLGEDLKEHLATRPPAPM
jgi:hypothetical protein